MRIIPQGGKHPASSNPKSSSPSILLHFSQTSKSEIPPREQTKKMKTTMKAFISAASVVLYLLSITLPVNAMPTDERDDFREAVDCVHCTFVPFLTSHSAYLSAHTNSFFEKPPVPLQDARSSTPTSTVVEAVIICISSAVTSSQLRKSNLVICLGEGCPP